VPSAAVPHNGARICRWLGADLDGGDPKGLDGIIDGGGRAAISKSTRQFNSDGSVTTRPFDHVTAAGDGAGFHHIHRLDLLMCLYKRVFEFGPDNGEAWGEKFDRRYGDSGNEVATHFVIDMVANDIVE